MRVIVYNLENFFIYIDAHRRVDLAHLDETQWQSMSSSIHYNKSLRHVRQIKKILQELDPDILMLTEVGGLESLKNFNELFLDETFNVHLIEGNSERGIDVGYLTRKNLGVDFEIFSHKERDLNFLYAHELQSLASGYTEIGGKPIKSHKFSRDVLELRVFNSAVSGAKLIAIFLLVHLKSHLDFDSIDPEGHDRREAEAKTLVEVYKELRAAAAVPVFIGGDFNGNASPHETHDEFHAIYRETDLIDALEKAGAVHADRTTYPGAGQLDYFFIPKNFTGFTKAWVEPYRDPFGKILGRWNLRDRSNHPSDHLPIVIDLELGISSAAPITSQSESPY